MLKARRAREICWRGKQNRLCGLFCDYFGGDLWTWILDFSEVQLYDYLLNAPEACLLELMVIETICFEWQRFTHGFNYLDILREPTLDISDDYSTY